MPSKRKRETDMPSMSKKRKTDTVTAKQIASKFEKKYFDTQVGPSTVSASGSIVATVNNIVAGNGPSDRDGRKVTITNIYMNGNIAKTPGVLLTDAGDLIRTIVYLDKQCNAAAIQVGDLLAVGTCLSYRNLANIERFQILYDETETINSSSFAVLGGIATGSATRAQIKRLNKKVNIPIYFNGNTGGNVGDITSNNIGILHISLTGTSTIQTKMRIRFTDN